MRTYLSVAAILCATAWAAAQPPTDVAKDIAVALAALTVVVNRQTDGYAHVPVP
jgi:hypothetical protein